MSNISIEDTGDSGIVTLPTAYLMDLPDELAEWVMQNQELVMRVQDALKKSYAAIPTEDQIWEVIAATCDPNPPQWHDAREDLRTAQQAWDDLHHPMNAPLGLIGRALDGPEIANVNERLTLSLAHFTMINEGLRQRQDLSTLLTVLLVLQRMLKQSAGLMPKVEAATDELGEIISLCDVFGRVAKRPSRISRQFKAAMRLLLPKKQFNATSVIVPWSQET